jgi:hypothetical protein
LLPKHGTETARARIDGEDIEGARLLAREIVEAGRAYLVEDSLDLAICEGAAIIGIELVRDDLLAPGARLSTVFARRWDLRRAPACRVAAR